MRIKNCCLYASFPILVMLFDPCPADTWVDSSGEMFVEISDNVLTMTDVSSFHYFDKVFESAAEGYWVEFCFGFDSEEENPGTECIETEVSTSEEQQGQVRSLIFRSTSYAFDFNTIDYFLSVGRKLKAGASDGVEYVYLELDKKHKLNDRAKKILSYSAK